VKGKRSLLEQYIEVRECDACLLTEPLNDEKPLEIKGFSSFSSRQRTEGENKHSGVAVATWDKSRHPIVELEMKENHRGILWSFVVEKRLAVATIYCPPDDVQNDSYARSLYKCLLANILELGDTPFILLGDFNVPFKERNVWPMGRNSELLRNLVSKEGRNISIVNWSPLAKGSFETRFRHESKSQLDLVLASDSALPYIASVETTGEDLGSDHVILEVEIRILEGRQEKESREVAARYDWNDKAKTDRYLQKSDEQMLMWLNRWGLSGCREMSEINAASKDFVHALKTAAEGSVMIREARTVMEGKRSKEAKVSKVTDVELRRVTENKRSLLKELAASLARGENNTTLRNRYIRVKQLQRDLADRRNKERSKEACTKLEEGFDAKGSEEFWSEVKRETDPRQSNLPRLTLVGCGNKEGLGRSI
jgi:endonuclease/exonuclease/phosphatase family metal-dependent hydrolase